MSRSLSYSSVLCAVRVDVFPPRHSARPFHHTRSSIERLLPSSSYHPSSCCLTTSSPSDFFRPFPRSLVPPSLLLSCAPLYCPCIAQRTMLAPVQCSVLCCPCVSAAARGSTNDEPEATTKPPGVPLLSVVYRYWVLEYGRLNIRHNQI
jgi:hypothetical protein